MTRKMEFPDCEPRYLPDSDCLAFRCLVDGKSVECVVTSECLQARFDASDLTEEAMRNAFRKYRIKIESIARSHIDNGWVDEDNTVILTTRFTDIVDIQFTERLKQWPEGLGAAERAQRKLNEIIGPNAEKVLFKWDCDEPSVPPGLNCVIEDLTISHYEIIYLPVSRWEDPYLSLNLASAWASILRDRSRKRRLKLGVGERYGR